MGHFLYGRLEATASAPTRPTELVQYNTCCGKLPHRSFSPVASGKRVHPVPLNCCLVGTPHHQISPRWRYTLHGATGRFDCRDALCVLYECVNIATQAFVWRETTLDTENDAVPPPSALNSISFFYPQQCTACSGLPREPYAGAIELYALFAIFLCRVRRLARRRPANQRQVRPVEGSLGGCCIFAPQPLRWLDWGAMNLYGNFGRVATVRAGQTRGTLFPFIYQRCFIVLARLNPC